MISQELDTRTADLSLRVDTTPRQGFSTPVAAPASPLASDVPSLTSSSAPKTLKTDLNASLERQNEDEMLPKGTRESLPGNGEPTPSKPGIPSQPPTLLDSEEHHTSPLDDLLSPQTTPAQAQSFVRDSVAGSDFGEVKLDDERFSTVSLNAATARGSTVAIISPVDEKARKPWEEEEPPLAPSEVSNTSVRASLLLQRLGNDTTPSRRSLDEQHKLQEVFERARDSKDLEGELANVDWGVCFFDLFVVRDELSWV
ncbi:hypothetical protein EI94DRAFT_691818 [Lactarius quietus]|nr:hypothetical protein EI94DRAFT_691818 [Lactarius quietus]